MKWFPSSCILIIACICSIYLYQVMQLQAWSQAEILLRHVLHGISKQIAQEGVSAQHWPKFIRPTEETNHLRITIINREGFVIADNHGDPVQMDNHLLRPEIRDALTAPSHVGQSKRISRSIGIDYYYFAEAFFQDQGLQGFVRLAMPTDNIVQRLSAHFIAVASPLYLVLLGIGIFWQRQHLLALNHKRSTEHLDSTEDSHAVTHSQDSITWPINLAGMLNSLNEGIIAVNNDEHIVYINKTAANLLNSSETELVGKSIWNVTRIHRIPESIHNCLRKSEIIYHEFQIVKHVKHQSYVLQVSPVAPTKNNAYAAVAIINDVTDQMRVESLRKNFFTNISHELKTPLAVIKGVLETILDDDQMSEAQRRIFLNKALKQSTRLNELIVDILTISHLEEQESLHDREPVSLNSVLRECVNLLNTRAEQKQIHIITQLHNEDCMIEGDRELLRQIFDNIISNAINYSPADSQVQIILETTPEWHIISVIDEGQGIPPLAQERIFERFYRVDKARSRQLGGTGLGLSIAKHATALHRGHITVQSEILKGSTFKVHLPNLPNLAPGVQHD